MSSTQPLTQARTEYSNNSTDRTSSSLTRSRSIIGLHLDAPIDEEHDQGPASELLWLRIRAVLREPFAEFWGVAIMVMFGDGSVAQVLLSTGQATHQAGTAIARTNPSIGGPSTVHSTCILTDVPQLGSRRHARDLRRRRLMRISQPSHNALQLPFPPIISQLSWRRFVTTGYQSDED